MLLREMVAVLVPVEFMQATTSANDHGMPLFLVRSYSPVCVVGSVRRPYGPILALSQENKTMGTALKTIAPPHKVAHNSPELTVCAVVRGLEATRADHSIIKTNKTAERCDP